ncbi:MAG: trypsin-like peptidase domain-containing protein [Candidatus Nitrosocosmicus sp.]|nr:trypsin-like peptidase domain-containing protein [Candidatus Nitrosocosmicus sp.]
MTLSLGLYFVLTTINILVTENHIFVNAFAQQQVLPNMTKNDNIFMNTNNNTLSSSNSSDKPSEEVLIDLYDKVDHSVVQVTQDSNVPGASRLGSGFVYDKEGHIVTNYHVVAGDTINKEFDITFTDGTGYKATIVGVDPFAEIAVLKIPLENNTEVKEKLKPLQIGNFSEVSVGQRVAAIGNPFGLSASITEGIVSGLGRVLPALPSENSQIPIVEDTPAPSFSIPDIIQTDAAINPGNSGGPLLNMRGEVIGINTAIFSATGVYSGVGFAIPSYLIQKAVPSLIAAGEYQHPYLGVSGTDIDSDIAEIMNLQNTTGFLVIQVTSGSPAEKAGIRGGAILTEIDGREVELGGDVIIGIDNIPIRKIDDLLSYLSREKKVGENVTLSIIRNGQVQEIGLTLAARPTSTVLDSEIIQETQENRPSLGITGIKVSPEIALQMNVPSSIINGGEKGFLVIDVIRNGSADEAGIRGGYIASNINGNQVELGGDIIIGIDNITIGSVEDIRKALSTKQVGDSVQLAVYRDNSTVEIPIVLKEDPESDLTENTIPLPSPFLPPPPNNPGDNPPLQQPFNPFDFGNDIYNQCVEIVGKDTCDRLFGR